mgnify:CR=1 FL=1
MGSFQARAVIFDLDGVLVDSEPGYAIALNRVLEREGAEPLTENESRGLIGTTVEDTWNAIKEMRSLTKPFEYYLGIYSLTLIEIFSAGLELQPGAMDVVREVKDSGLPLGLATSSRRAWVDVKLEVVGVNSIFDAVVTGDEVQKGKPSPEIYLSVARLLGIPQAECLAIEDSPSGVASAVAAGMYTVALRTESTAGLDISHANAVIESLEQFDMGLLGGSELSPTTRYAEAR